MNLHHALEAYATPAGGVVMISPIDIVFGEYDVVQATRVTVFESLKREHGLFFNTK
jgi:uncharacterized membrane protein